MNTQLYSQAAKTILMIRPKYFGFNNQTSKTNVFQTYFDNIKIIGSKAIKEFDDFVGLLRKYEVNVIVVEDETGVEAPDAVFPNNWFSTHHDGKVVLYPMLAKNRRKEIRPDIFDMLKNDYHYQITEVKNWSAKADQNLFLEGTGSIVFDHRSKIGYANISLRTNRTMVESLCNYLNYEPIIFDATSKTCKEIYHTNVMLTVAESFALICADSIRDVEVKKTVLNKLSATGHEVVIITFEQMEKFAGNMLQVKNKMEENLTILSQSAFESLNEPQLEVILKHNKVLPVPISTIESVGGGSVRCMMAEIFLPKK